MIERIILRLFGWWEFDGYRLDFAASRFTLRGELWYRRKNVWRRLRRSTQRTGFGARKTDPGPEVSDGG